MTILNCSVGEVAGVGVRAGVCGMGGAMVSWEAGVGGGGTNTRLIPELTLYVEGARDGCNK